MMAEKKLAVIIICPDCGKQIKVLVDESTSITIGDAGPTSRASDRPDGGTRGESQEEYLGG